MDSKIKFKKEFIYLDQYINLSIFQGSFLQYQYQLKSNHKSFFLQQSKRKNLLTYQKKQIYQTKKFFNANKHFTKLDLFQAQPFIKNSHLITHIHIYKNQEIIVFTDNAIHIYSYQQIIRDEAALVHIVQFQKILKSAAQYNKNILKQTSSNPKNSQKQKSSLSNYHMDQITQIFDSNNPNTRNRNKNKNSQQSQNPAKKSFGQLIFQDLNDINSNILLKGNYFLDRLSYLNQNRIKNVQLSVHGDLLISFFSGRLILIQRNNNIPYYKNFNVIDLNVISKKKIQFGKFIQGTHNILIFYSDRKLWIYDYLRHVEQCSTLYIESSINNIYGFSIQENNKQYIILTIQFPTNIQFLNYNRQKKKINNLAYFSLSELNFSHKQFIENVFIYQKCMNLFISTSLNILKIDINNIITHLNAQNQIHKIITTKISRSKSKQSQKSYKSQSNKEPTLFSLSAQLIYQFSIDSPQQMLYINDRGDYFPKQKITSKQYIHKICQTHNGIYIGITCKKGGNYKQGQLLIGLPQNYFNQMIRKSCQQIKSIQKSKFDYINFKDLILLTIDPKIKKQILSQVGKFVNETFQKYGKLMINNDINIEKLQIQIQGIQINQNLFEILALNLGVLFDSKQNMRQQKVQKRIVQHFKQRQKQRNKNNISMAMNIKNIRQKCIFTHKQINNQPNILECRLCDVYGIKYYQDNIKIYQDGLRNGYHRCYICLNQMKLIK